MNSSEITKKRLQLTLFVDESQSVEIENIRRKFNIEQYSLIKSHVTLCRENELEELGNVLHNLVNLTFSCFTINFGNVVRFFQGKGVLMPGVGENLAFYNLRESVLYGNVEKNEKFSPHITLMHPRNSICSDLEFAQIQKIVLPNAIKFRKISLIEQEAMGKWQVLREFELVHDTG